MNFGEREESITGIPFPTVTLCPETKTYKDKLDFFTVAQSLIYNTELGLTEIE